MASNCLEEPYVLLSIPKPFGGQDAKSYAAPVHRYSSASAKQRSEIVVAVDGEGIYIYDVSGPRLVSSYAVSPQTQFLCKPCSIMRRKSDRLAQRLTYAAIRQKNSKHTSVIAFLEDVGNRAANVDGASAMTNKEYIFTEHDTNISALLPMPRAITHDEVSESFDLIVVHDTRTIQALSGDLQALSWSFTWPKSDNADLGTRFDFASLTSLADMEKGLLSRFPGAAAAAETWGPGRNKSNILVLIRADRSKSSLRSRWSLSLLRVPNTRRGPSNTPTVGESVSIYDVQSFSCPKHIELKHSSSRPTFRITSSWIYLFAQIADSLVQWNFSDVQPVGQLACPSGLASCLPVNHSELLVSESDKCSIIDVDWQTTQGEVRLRPEAETPRKIGMKRGRETGLTSFANSEFVDVFPKAGIAVGIRSDSLFAVPIVSTRSSKRQRTGPRTLADSVGKGSIRETGNPLSFDQRKEIKREVDSEFANTAGNLVKDNRIADLEEFLAKDLDLSYERVVLEDAVDGKRRIFVTLEEGERERLSGDVVHWTFPKDVSTLIRRSDWTKASLIFDLIFTKTDGKPCDFTARFYSPSIYKWLAVVGLFTTKNYKISTSKNQTTAAAVLIGLANVDPTLSLVGQFISWPFHIDLEVIACALEIAIKSLDSPIGQPKLSLEEAPSNQTQESALEDDSVANASRAAEEDLALAIASLNEGTTIRGGLLRSIFDRLSAFEDGAIVKSFAKVLSPRHLVFLINLLRIELADGGWTTRYTDEIFEDHGDINDEGPSDQSIRIIVKLLNAAVDAVGPTGWNVGLSSDKQLNSDEMLLVLRAEITAALEGSQEYQAIGAALQDFTRYCSEVEPLDKASRRRKEIDAVRNPGFVRDDKQDVLLPMGARTDRLELTRTSKGGKVSVKSKAALGQELSMRVGKYSLDRIRV
ncbi:hypothetical protein ANO11243_070450 [Dothideomycetidae sp. 11243]|nr:hypothetical protein ANO11243_070450 [fungal sp. No.11243]